MTCWWRSSTLVWKEWASQNSLDSSLTSKGWKIPMSVKKVRSAQPKSAVPLFSKTTRPHALSTPHWYWDNPPVCLRWCISERELISYAYLSARGWREINCQIVALTTMTSQLTGSQNWRHNQYSSAENIWIRLNCTGSQIIKTTWKNTELFPLYKRRVTNSEDHCTQLCQMWKWINSVIRRIIRSENCETSRPAITGSCCHS